MIEPAFDLFQPRHAAGETCLLTRRLIADLETPVSAFLKLSAQRQGRCFLLESVEGGAARGRYSMIGLDPDVIFRATAGTAEIAMDALADPEAFVPCPETPLVALRSLIASSRITDTAASHLPPMAAGVFGYLGYDMVREMERLAPAKPDPIGVPDSIFMRPTMMVVFDTVRDEISVVTPVRPSAGFDAAAAYGAAERRIAGVMATLEGPLPPGATSFGAGTSSTPVAPVSNTPPERYIAMVEQAQEYIRAGDIFQAVLSQRFSAPFALPPFSLYRSLRRVNPAPFLCYLDFGGFQIVCSSPEILVRVRDDIVTIRPIAGTRRRGGTKADDDALAAELLADDKECAEHLMLLDLGRNDVGRVAQIGSVKVTDRFSIERYSHVMHIVSNVEGRLDARHGPRSTRFRPAFPRARSPARPRCGRCRSSTNSRPTSAGSTPAASAISARPARWTPAIVLRTAVVKDGVMHVQAGAGIVYDSDPASEQQECRNKAQALFRAAEEAVRYGV